MKLVSDIFPATYMQCLTACTVDYNPSNPQASHFTQVVWKGTQQVGCAVQSCNGIFAASFGVSSQSEFSTSGN